MQLLFLPLLISLWLSRYQCDYKMEAMRGMGVDRHLFGLYIMAKGLKMDPMPKMFTDKVRERDSISFIATTQPFDGWVISLPTVDKSAT